MIRYYNYIICTFLCFFSWEGYAQSYSAKIQKLSIQDGLSNRFVKQTLQDYKGFIWLATSYGLNRYDGYAFEVYTVENSNLSSNIINKIYEAKDSTIWITYNSVDGMPLGEVDVLDLNTSKITSLTTKLKQKLSLAEDDFFELYQGQDQSIFILTKDKVVYEYLGNEQFKELFQLPHPVHTLEELWVTNKGIWGIGVGYILQYTREGEWIEEYNVAFNHFFGITKVQDDCRIYGYNSVDSLVGFSITNRQIIPSSKLAYLTSNVPKWQTPKILYQPNSELWWLIGDQRVQLYNTQGALIYDFSNYIMGKSIHVPWSASFDAQDNLWLATSGGAFILSIKENNFRQYLNYNEFIPKSFAHSIRGMIEYKGELYVNTYSGRKKINLKTGKIATIDDEKMTAPEMGALLDKDEFIWFCGEKKSYIERFNPRTNETQRFSRKTYGEDIDKRYRLSNITLHQDQKERIWLGSRSGVYYFDPTANAFIKKNAYGLCEALNTSTIYAFEEDTLNQILWLGTSTGVYKYDYKLGRFTRKYAPSESAPYYIPHGYILSLYWDQKEHCLWIGTSEGGLIRWLPQRGKYEHFTVASGLSDNVIYGILEEEEEYLWLSSNYGLMRFQKSNGSCETFLPEDGVTGYEFNRLAAYKAPSGQFYFGGINGLIAFDPKKLKKPKKVNIPIYVLKYESLRNTAKQLEDKTEEFRKENKILFGPQDNFFKLTFSLLDFRGAKDRRYRYKIEGLGDSWQYTNENAIIVNRLPYGDYFLIIEGEDSNGIWSNNRLRIFIDVEAPFYKTMFFAIIVMILLGGVILIGIRITIRNNERNKAYLEEEIANRTQMLLEREQDLLKAKEEAEKSSLAKAEFLSVMSHEIRTPMNAVVNLTNYLLEDTPADRQVENLNILKFSANNLLAIINDVLDFNKIESGKVEFEYIDFDLLSLLDSIHYGMAVNAKKKGIEFLLETNVELKQMLVGDPNRLTQVLNNLISNAIKFTENGYVKLTLDVLKEDQDKIELKFLVEDTGIGIAEDERNYIFNMFTQAASDTTRKYGGTGLGLAITKRLLQLQGSDIHLDSKIGKGSSFYFDLLFRKGEVLANTFTAKKEKEQVREELKGAQILVVEDNAVNVLVVKKFLKKWGMNFTHAVDGVEAVEATKKIDFDLILMDIHMPNMDGYTATKIIRKMNSVHYQSVPIIALTASALMDNKERINEAGMNEIIVKPFKPNELQKVLIKYLA